jgi:FkbM family methyltransferase
MAAPEFKGRDRLFLELRRWLRAPNGLVMYQAADGSMWALDLDDQVDATLYVFGDFDPDTQAALMALASKDTIVFDVGANIGVVSVPLSRVSQRVFAFEPTAAVYQRLARNLTLNRCKNATPIAAALGSQRSVGVVRFPLPHRSGENYVQVMESESSSTVQVVTLDDFAREHAVQPTLIKIDVEGAEWEVLKGSQRTLRNSPHVILEVNTDTARRTGHHPFDMLRWLTDEFGYTFRVIAGDRLQEVPWACGADTLAFNVVGLTPAQVGLFDAIDRSMSRLRPRTRFEVWPYPA